MSQTGPLSNLITQAARRNLRPLGLFQKGRSRTWLADEGWWMVHVEFQPSDGSKGCYLNVGCSCLWTIKLYLSFDLGHRVERLWRFESEEQFAPIADMLSQRAAEETLRYRRLFPTVQAASNHFLESPPAASFWPQCNAAVMHGLAGRPDEGAALLNGPRKWDFSIEWHRNAAEDAHMLAGLIHQRDQFRDLIETRIHHQRLAQTAQTRKDPTLIVHLEQFSRERPCFVRRCLRPNPGPGTLSPGPRC